jgi:GxxExxY protein
LLIIFLPGYNFINFATMSASRERCGPGLSQSIDYGIPSDETVSPIRTLSDLEAHLPHICESIAEVLGKRNLEATYQRALKMDLEEAGVEVMEEVPINILYKGKPVATRRADLILKTADGQVSIIELKAIASLTGENLRQMEYYLAHFRVDTGFLVNFPHEVGFPDISDIGCVFSQLRLSGDVDILPDRTTRAGSSRVKPRTPQVVKVVRCHSEEPEKVCSGENTTTKVKKEQQRGGHAAAAAVSGLDRTDMSSPAAAGVGRSGTGSGSRAGPGRVFGITAKGTPCKVCIQLGEYCKYHSDQAPSASGTPVVSESKVFGTNAKGTPCKVCIQMQGYCKYHGARAPK